MFVISSLIFARSSVIQKGTDNFQSNSNLRLHSLGSSLKWPSTSSRRDSRLLVFSQQFCFASPMTFWFAMMPPASTISPHLSHVDCIVVLPCTVSYQLSAIPILQNDSWVNISIVDLVHHLSMAPCRCSISPCFQAVKANTWPARIPLLKLTVRPCGLSYADMPR